jgi:hypothetical protein
MTWNVLEQLYQWNMVCRPYRAYHTKSVIQGEAGYTKSQGANTL